MSLSELKAHLFSLPEHPDWIPYRTSYYEENWGFCLAHEILTQLHEGDYEVYIDSELKDGHLSYGECILPGESADEILISCTSCHPSMCNDNLSGMVLTTFLAKRLLEQSPRRYSYRFLFVPGTIGPITWLSCNEDTATRIRHGLVAVCVGDSGHFTYKKSRQGTAEIDHVVSYVLDQSGVKHDIREFSPYGYEERQYCSPGFNLPVGCLMRTPHGEFPEYHTSADDLEFVTAEALQESYEMYWRILDVLENNRCYINLNPKGEPNLGKRGLYGAIGGASDKKVAQMAMLWVLNFSDGRHSLLDITKRSRLPFSTIHKAAHLLAHHGLLREKLTEQGQQG